MDAALTDAVIAHVYSAAAGRQPWETALNMISVACDAWAVQLLSIDRQRGSAVFSHYGGIAPAQAHLTYLRDYQRIDPRAPLVLAPGARDWIHCHEEINEEQVAASPFYQDFLIPAGARYVSIARLASDDETVAILGILRAVGKMPLEALAIGWVDRLRPHLAQAVAIYSQLSAAHQERCAGRVILDRLNHPILLVDAAGFVRHSNAAARDALAARLAIYQLDGQLRCSAAADDLALGQALASLTLTAPDSTEDGRCFIRLRGTHAQHRYGISLSALRPAETLGAFGAGPMVMVVLHDDSVQAHCDPFVIQELFGLTPAEADVGMLLSAGHSVERIAKQRHVALSTVRSQLRMLLMKTGSERQSDLVRRLLSFPDGLGG